MRTTPLSDVLGVEVSDVDLSGELGPSEASALRELFVAHSLVLFRDQELTEEDQRRCILAIGPVSTALLPPGDRGFYLSNEYADGRGELVPHSDHCFLRTPLWGISLYCLAAPLSGGQTVFTSAIAACRRLPDDVRSALEGRDAVHAYVARERLGDAIRDPELPDELVATHPVLWRHPVSGATVLYVNPWMTRAVVGLDPDDSARLLGAALSCLRDESLTYRHSWRSGDFLVWDNIALLHARTEYDPAERRLLQRMQMSLP